MRRGWAAGDPRTVTPGRLDWQGGVAAAGIPQRHSTCTGVHAKVGGARSPRDAPGRDRADRLPTRSATSDAEARCRSCTSTPAFVKLLTDEPGSELAAALWEGCDAAVSSRLAYPEVRAALAAAARDHDLTAAERDTAEGDWDQFWAATRPVELSSAIEQHAGHLARLHALRGADACT